MKQRDNDLLHHSISQVVLFRITAPYAHAGLQNFFVATCPSPSRRASAAG
jgi:hypothetical protein